MRSRPKGSRARRERRRVAALILVVLDRSATLTADDHRLLEDTAAATRVLVANKSDLPHAWSPGDRRERPSRCRQRPARESTALREAIVLSRCEPSAWIATCPRSPTRVTPRCSPRRGARWRERRRRRARRARGVRPGGRPQARAPARGGHRAPRRRTRCVHAIFAKFCIGK